LLLALAAISGNDTRVVLHTRAGIPRGRNANARSDDDGPPRVDSIKRSSPRSRARSFPSTAFVAPSDPIYLWNWQRWPAPIL